MCFSLIASEEEKSEQKMRNNFGVQRVLACGDPRAPEKKKEQIKRQELSKTG